FFLGAQNPPLDAARLDIMPPLLWGRAEAVRTLLRSLAMALAPLLFGAVSDHVFGGGRSGLQWTFIVMILPLGASSWLLFQGLRRVPPTSRRLPPARTTRPATLNPRITGVFDAHRRHFSLPLRVPGERRGVRGGFDDRSRRRARPRLALLPRGTRSGDARACR